LHWKVVPSASGDEAIPGGVLIGGPTSVCVARSKCGIIYAIFYAANALLSTKKLERSKHSGVIAAFRQHFVKTGLIEAEYGRFYGEAMEQRNAGDYGLVSPNRAAADRSLAYAERFVQRVEQALRDVKAIL
jgi:uncharacterized protein (UPF0332 family)